MPLYRVFTRSSLLSLEQRQAFSQDVVDVHCEVTGAPPSFVHVLFVEGATSQLQDDTAALIVASIRSGRDDAQKQKIRETLSTKYASYAGTDTSKIAVVSVDIDASYVMEGGKFLPEPGSAEEQEWKEPSHV